MADLTTEKPEKPTPPKSTAKSLPPRITGWRWIMNNEERVRILVLRGVTSSVSRIPNPGPRIELTPGASIVEARLWEEWKTQNADREDDGAPIQGKASELLKGTIPEDTHRHRRAERAGQPYLVEGPAIKNDKAPLADLAEQEALAVVGYILDEGMLRRQLTIEKRSTVAATISAKLEMIQKAVAQASAGI